MKGRLKIKRIEASYTIEVAYILPLAFACMYGIIFLGFYLHDRIVMEQSAWEGAVYGGGQLMSLERPEIETYVKERLEGRLFVSKIEQVNITIGSGKVSIELLGKADIPKFPEAILGYKQEKGIHVKRTFSYPCSVDYVRKGLVISEQIKKLWENK